MISAAKRIAIKHLEPRFYGALWFLGVFIIVSMAVMTTIDRPRFREEITLLAALLALTIATIGWIWSGRMGILMARKTNALAILERISSASVHEIKEVVYPYIEQYDNFRRQDCGERPKMPELEVQKLLGVYEQLAVAIIHGAVDHDMIKASQQLVVKRIYRGLFHHIERAQERDPTLFINFESLCCSWHPDLQRKAAALSDPGGLFSPMRGSDS